MYALLSFYPIKAIQHIFGEYEINTHSKLYESFYFRIVYYTKYVSLPKFVFYGTMNVIGTTFVTCITLQLKRKNPFYDQHYSMASFYKTLLVVNPAMFLMTFIVNLRGANDLKSYCKDDAIDP